MGGAWQAKVGRKIVKANETNTTIKSKALSMQKQSVAVDRSGQEVSSRGLTLPEILSHSTHYAPTMRKECLAGVKDYFTLHPRTLDTHVGAVLDKVSDLVTDQDSAVRKELRGVVSLFISEASQSCLAPFLGMYLVHVCGGLSHVHEHIRASSLLLLDDVVPAYPAVVARHAPKLLPIFIHILSGGETAPVPTSKGSKPSGKEQRVPRLKTVPLSVREAVLSSMHSYLRAVAANVVPDALPTPSPGVSDGRADASTSGRTEGGKKQAASAPPDEAGKEVHWSTARRTQLGVFRGGLGGRGAPVATSIWAVEGGRRGAGAGSEAGVIMAEFCEGAIALLVQSWQELWPLAAEDKTGLRVMLQVALHLLPAPPSCGCRG